MTYKREKRAASVAQHAYTSLCDQVRECIRWQFRISDFRLTLNSIKCYEKTKLYSYENQIAKIIYVSYPVKVNITQLT